LDKGFGIENVVDNKLTYNLMMLFCSISRRFYTVKAGYYCIKATPRMREIALLGKFAYPELGFIRVSS
jgi:hypothetical protein